MTGEYGGRIILICFGRDRRLVEYGGIIILMCFGRDRRLVEYGGIIILMCFGRDSGVWWESYSDVFWTITLLWRGNLLVGKLPHI